MGHYYENTPTGIQPRHFVEMSTRPGEIRPTRITDVRKWWKEGRPVVPSVTTVLDVLAKHALVNWKIEQHLEQAFEYPPKDDDMAAWMAEVKRRTEVEMDKAPTAGTDVHGSLELYAAGMLPESHGDFGLCEKAFAQIEFNTATKRAAWTTERKFVSPLGFGGQVDLSPVWFIDYKSKQDPAKWKPGKMVYDEHAMQLAAYRQGMGFPHARCANVFLCPGNGEIDFHEHSEVELQRGWRMFQHALGIWQEQNNWQPMKEAKAA